MSFEVSVHLYTNGYIQGTCFSLFNHQDYIHTETLLLINLPRALSLSQLENFVLYCLAPPTPLFHGGVTEFTGITAQGFWVLTIPVLVP